MPSSNSYHQTHPVYVRMCTAMTHTYVETSRKTRRNMYVRTYMYACMYTVCMQYIVSTRMVHLWNSTCISLLCLVKKVHQIRYMHIHRYKRRYVHTYVRTYACTVDPKLYTYSLVKSTSLLSPLDNNCMSLQ